MLQEPKLSPMLHVMLNEDLPHVLSQVLSSNNYQVNGNFKINILVRCNICLQDDGTWELHNGLQQSSELLPWRKRQDEEGWVV